MQNIPPCKKHGGVFVYFDIIIAKSTKSYFTIMRFGELLVVKISKKVVHLYKRQDIGIFLLVFELGL